MTLQLAFNIAAAAAGFLCVFLLRQAFGALRDIEKSHGDHKVLVAENYVKRHEFDNALTRIEGYFQKISDKLDSKQDKDS
jgi:hypothetical protein